MSHPNESTYKVLREVLAERKRQNKQWGAVQRFPDYPDLGGRAGFVGHFELPNVDRVKGEVDKDFVEKRSNYASILLEEVMEVYDESDPVRLREELVQVAAVAVKWIEAIDMRQEGK